MTVTARVARIFRKSRKIRTSYARFDGSTAFIGEGGVAAAPVAPTPVMTAVSTILTRHVLRDGEVVLLILKPSQWYIPLSSLKFIAGILIALCALQLSHPQHMRYDVDAALFCVCGRLMWAILSWMGRLYVLTDQRILRLSGVLHVDVIDCPLRKVAFTKLVRSIRDRLLALGSIEIHPSDESRPGSVWQMVRHSTQVHAEIKSAIRRAKQGGTGNRFHR